MEDLVEKLMKSSLRKRPDQFEAYASKNSVITVRIAMNEVVEAKQLISDGCSVRFIKNKSVGFAATNDLSKTDMLIDEANRHALSKDADPFFKKLPDPERIKPVRDLYDKKFFDLEMTKVVDWGKEIIDTGLGLDPKVDISGSINVVTEKAWIRNSNGVDISDVNTFLMHSLTVEKGEDNSSLGEFGGRKLNEFKPEAVVTKAMDDLKLGNPRKVSPGKFKIVFGPHAMANLLEHIISYAMLLPAVDSGFSYIADKLNQKIADERLTIYDDGRHPTGIGTKAVDDEGVPTNTVKLIAKGILKTFIGDSYFVYKMMDSMKGIRLTGNGFRFGAVPGRDYGMLPSASPTNLVVDKGDFSDEELIKEIKEGMYIGRVWYTYPINPTVGEFSCTNRSNTFWVENGEIKQSVLPNSFRINDNILNLLNNIIGIGSKQEQSILWGGTAGCISPNVAFNNVNVSYSK